MKQDIGRQKRDSLRKHYHDEESLHRWKEQRNIAIKLLRDKGETYKSISNMLKEGGNRMGITQIGDICKSFKKDKVVNEDKTDDLDKKEPESNDLT